MVFLCVFLCARYSLNQLAWIYEMLHKHGPRAVLSLEQGLRVFFILQSNLAGLYDTLTKYIRRV